MHLPDILQFASPALLAALAGAGLLAVSLVAALGERRRRLRKDIDAVGLLPWRDIGAVTSFVGLILLVMALAGWAGGG